MRIANAAHDRSAPPTALLAAGRKEFETLARTPAVWLGVYRCGHKHHARGADEVTLGYTINFPRHGVYVKHVRGRELLVAPGRAVFFNRGEPFSTSHPHGCGDGGRWLAVRGDVLRQTVEQLDPCALERPELPFRSTDVGVDAETELMQAALFARSHELDTLRLEELSLAVVARLMRATKAQESVLDVERRPAHRELAAGVQRRLAQTPERPSTLEALAREFGVSMFHLSRVFKACTGDTLHGFRERARLRASLDALAGGAVDLTHLALACGYSSHSHFSRAFRRRFGLTPSAFRSVASRARLADLGERLR